MMSQGQRILTIALWAVLVVVMLGVIGAGAWDRLHDQKRPGTSKPDELFDAPAFSLTDQEGRTLTDKDLRGHPYVASFVFTQCAGPCPMITGKVAALEKSIKDPNVKFVSFSVDPEHDTPAVLKQYAAGFQADPARWHFLTGDPKAVYAAVRGMNMALEPATESSPIIHSTRLLLIDGQGKCRGVYDGGEQADPETLNRLARDAEKLAR
jgi:cytochrome oxidase Cu insertion factor (SCO1/SenC/PrrC family)